MRTEMILKSKSCSLKKFGLRCFLLPVILLAAGILYSYFLYTGNVNNCRQYMEVGHNLMAYQNNYSDFLILTLLYGKFSKLLPLLLYAGLFLLMRGIHLYRTCGKGEMTITEQGIRGKSTSVGSISLPLSAVKEAVCGRWESVLLRTDAGEISFYHIENREEICSLLKKLIETSSDKPDCPFCVPQLSVSGCRCSSGQLAVLCFLPAALLFLAFLFLGAEQFVWYTEIYGTKPNLFENEIFLFKLLANVLSGNMGQLTRLCFYLFFPVLAAGIYFWTAYKNLSLEINGGKITGNSRFGGRLEISSHDCCAVSSGKNGTLILYHAGGKSIFRGLRNQGKIRSALETLWGFSE